jgi:branched-chain amino acid aminotransferase
MVAYEEAGLPIDNGAFRYGYGLFETMLVQDGDIRLKQYHWERLFAGIKQLSLELPAPVNPGYLEDEVLHTVRKNKLEKLSRVRLQVYAGGGGLYGPDAARAGFVIECFPLDVEITRFNQNGLVVGIAEGLCKSTDTLSNLKSCNALVYAMAARQAKANKWNDALILNTSGNIAESTIANLFWVKDGKIFTPPLFEGCVAGVMRRYIIEKNAITEMPLTREILQEADEIFLSNAIRGIKWAGSFNDRQLRNETAKNICELSFPH